MFCLLSWDIGRRETAKKRLAKSYSSTRAEQKGTKNRNKHQKETVIPLPADRGRRTLTDPKTRKHTIWGKFLLLCEKKTDGFPNRSSVVFL